MKYLKQYVCWKVFHVSKLTTTWACLLLFKRWYNTSYAVISDKTKQLDLLINSSYVTGMLKVYN